MVDIVGLHPEDEVAHLDERSRQVAFDLDRPPSYAAEDFIVSEANGLAFEHLAAFPNWPTPLCLLVGPPKAGKTHLARMWQMRTGARAVRAHDIGAVAQEGGEVPLLVEDADRAGYEETALFHLLNQSMRGGRAVLMTARSAPEEWPLRTDDVRSRVRLAARFTVAAADDMQLSQMFVKLFGDRQIKVDPKVVAYLVARMERSPQEVVALVELMDRLALVRKCKINRALAAEAIALRTQLHETKVKR